MHLVCSVLNPISKREVIAKWGCHSGLKIIMFSEIAAGIIIRNSLAIDFEQNQPFLYIMDPQSTRAKIGGRVEFHCQLSWKDALGNVWNGYIPPVQVQWIINGFGYHLDSLEAGFHRRLRVDGNTRDGKSDSNYTKW